MNKYILQMFAVADPGFTERGEGEGEGGNGKILSPRMGSGAEPMHMKKNLKSAYLKHMICYFRLYCLIECDIK